ncbi:patatin-like phospholipase family protein [Rufibacter psychrotolerans]|uniref:patatin-like phospholipase family protein n=1 Tax=Rufibacter psychrotolerans TaxID=2812556 RepID=UPI001966FC90|nr:patatin-like phospholipase family protein [Rufibacter sp. SYSU D00308]
MTLQQKLAPTSPKRILALDGGGIRGALTLGYLQKIEEILGEQHHHDPAFRLSHYFDLIGGTSTGAIIAAALAIGMKVEEIKTKYFELGGKIFGDRHKWYEVFSLLKARFDAGPLDKELQKVFEDITLGSDRIQTGLCIVTKRADTNSVWPIINHPEGKFFDSKLGRNKDILLWKAVRASAAAPTYFLPQVLDVGGGLPEAAFVDGGVSMANNPALQLLMVATLKGFPFKWKIGAENLLLVSVGTGMGKPQRLPQSITQNHLLDWAQQIPDMLMQDASWHNQLILQWLSASPTRWEIDSEIGKMEEDLLVADTSGRGLLAYLRYNYWLDQEHLQPLMEKPYSPKQIADLVDMSKAASRFELYEIGYKAAAAEVEAAHFPLSFKPESAVLS